MLGQAVLNDKGATIGHIVNVLIDQNGKTNAVVIEFAGFFGVGDRKVAVAWDALRFAVVKDQIAITVTLDAAKVKALPEYQPDAKSVPVATPQRGKAAP